MKEEKHCESTSRKEVLYPEEVNVWERPYLKLLRQTIVVKYTLPL
jgi:hypothetical protein